MTGKSSEQILLVGASGLAREVIATGIGGVMGIVDDNPALHGTEMAGVPVLGSIDAAADSGASLLVCVGPSASRRRIVRRLMAAGVGEDRFATYVAQSARVGRTSTVAVGSILLDNVVVTADARIGRHVVVMPNCTITHDDELEDFVTLAAGVALGGAVRVGEAAYIGMNAAVRQGLRIGAGSTVGMGAAVIADVPEEEVWVGVPARELGIEE
jgi:sugar O-acyltransferase (sialic acid O-acetyltransferase NeuD family)